MKTAEFLARLAEAFSTSPARISLDSVQSELDGWDSMGSINLISLIQDEFNLNLSMDELDGLESVRDILGLLEKKGKELE